MTTPRAPRTGRVEGKVAIVTGAGGKPGPGVPTGRATAIVLAREGAKVMLVDKHPDRAEDTKRIIDEEGGVAAVCPGDVTTADHCQAMVRATVEAFGAIDILVNNLGMGSLSDVVECTEEEWDRTLDINLRTTFLASKHTVPVMIERGGGAIVNVCSIVAFRGVKHLAYAAAKGGVHALTVDMAYSHGRQGIRVNAVAPGHLSSPMLHSQIDKRPGAGLGHGIDGDRLDTGSVVDMRVEASPLGIPGTGWDVATAVTFLASDEARWITGVTLPVDGGVMAVEPLAMADRLRNHAFN